MHSMDNLSTAIAGVEVDSRPRRDVASGLAVSLMAIIIVVGCVGQSLRACVCVYKGGGGGGGGESESEVYYIKGGGERWGGGGEVYYTRGWGVGGR